MTTRRWIAALLATAITLTSTPGLGQTAPTAAAATNVAPVIVRGSRLRADNEKTIAACQEMMKDPHARALIEAGRSSFMGRTRPPKNPDYNAPPSVPLDAPLPNLEPDDRAEDAALRARQEEGAGDAEAANLAAAVAQCIGSPSSRRIGGGDSGGPAIGAAGSMAFWNRLNGSSLLDQNHFAPYRSVRSYRAGPRQNTRPDKTLPLAMAIFDQGRYELALDSFKVSHKTLSDLDGGDEAALMIGKIYLYGLRERSDPIEAVRWLKWASGSYFSPLDHMQRFDPKRPEYTTAIAEASTILAELYAKGHGPIAKDPAQARKYLERAKETGYVPASKQLGDLYYQGVDTPRDLKKAFRHYMDAATYAYAPAAIAVARMYAAGEAPGGVDLARAAAWNNEAAKFEDPDALYALAVAYDRGEGVVPDPERALGFYKVAAVSGHPAGQTAIGTYFYAGERVPQDHAVARGWFEQAALAGDPEGMFNLAAMMSKGEGGELDRVRAWGWLKIAEQLEHPNAVAAARAVEAQFTAADRAGVEELTRGTEDLRETVTSQVDPEATIATEFVGSAPGGPPWWKVSKGEATVWIMGLAPGRMLSAQAWDTAAFRQNLQDARLLIVPYSSIERLTLETKPWPALPGPLASKVTAAAVQIRRPLRNRVPTLSDALGTYTTFYYRRFAGDAPLKLYEVARAQKVRIATPPRRPGLAPASLDPDSAGVAACVEGIVADISKPAEASKAASQAWANGDVAGALAAPRHVSWACRAVWPRHWEEAVGFQVEAVTMALDMRGKVVLAADIGQLVAETGILPQLRARGFTVSGPVQPGEP